MRTKIGKFWPLAAVLVPVLLAGCSAQPQSALPFGLGPQAVHIQRTNTGWDTDGGLFPAPPALNTTRTDRARVTQFFEHVRSLPTYTSDGIFHCLGHGTTSTTISFLDGMTVLLQMDFAAECGEYSIVDYAPNTFVQPDETFFQEFNDLIANPT